MKTATLAIMTTLVLATVPLVYVAIKTLAINYPSVIIAGAVIIPVAIVLAISRK